jgi:hypothetical protein
MDQLWRSFDEDVHDLDPLEVYKDEVWYMQICQKLIQMESKFPMFRRCRRKVLPHTCIAMPI